jgi:hypothetical protein
VVYFGFETFAVQWVHDELTFYSCLWFLISDIGGIVSNSNDSKNLLGL